MTDTIESLRQQLAECRATNGKLRGWIEKWCKFDSLNMDLQEWFRFSAEYKALRDGANDATALNELIAERTKELTAEVEHIKKVALEIATDVQDAYSEIRQQNAELTAEVAKLGAAIQLQHGMWVAARDECVELEQQNAELTAQRDAAEDEAGRMRAESADARGYALDLERRLQTAEADAKRYRMIRRGQHWSVINGIGDDIRGEILDEAIDAAIANCKEPGV